MAVAAQKLIQTARIRIERQAFNLRSALGTLPITLELLTLGSRILIIHILYNYFALYVNLASLGEMFENNPQR